MNIRSCDGYREAIKDKDFEEVKQDLLDKNEVYSKELSNYDPDFVKDANDKFKKLSKYEFNRLNEINDELLNLLKKAIAGDSSRDEDIYKLHTEWIKGYWPKYTKDMHLGLGRMYIEDERFKKYYDKVGVGAANYLCEVLAKYLSK